MTLVEMSVSASVLILVMMCLRAFVLQFCLPKRTLMLLWAVVFLRLLLPVSFDFPFSVFAFGQSVRTEVVFNNLPLAQVAESLGTANVESAFPWSIAWCTGFVLSVFYFTLNYVRCIVVFRSALPCHRKDVLSCAEPHRTNRKVQIRVSDRVSGAFTYGIIRPVIILPKHLLHGEWEQLELVLLHEWIHIKRCDTLKKAALTLVLCLHWFNPVTWFFYCRAGRDIELCCDESVLGSIGRECALSYAKTLLSMACRENTFSPLFTAFIRHPTEERIGAIMKPTPVKHKQLLPALVVCIALLVFCATEVHAARGEFGGDGTIVRQFDIRNLETNEKREVLFSIPIENVRFLTTAKLKQIAWRGWTSDGSLDDSYSQYSFEEK